MKILLLKDVAKVGRAGEIREVSDGFAQHALIPRGLARLATHDVVALTRQKATQIARDRAAFAETIKQSLLELHDSTISIAAKANEQGHLFAALHERDILNALPINVRSRITEEHMREFSPIKEVGEHERTVAYEGVETTIRIHVTDVS